MSIAPLELDDDAPETSPDEAMTREESDLMAEMRHRKRAAKEKRGAWADEARESYEFVAGSGGRESGGQWSEDDRLALKDGGRVAVEFNRVQPTVDVVAGMEVTNRHEVSYLQREEGDARTEEIATAASRWVRDQCDAEDEESEAFQDAVICGEGWTNTYLEYEYNADGDIEIERIDPLEIIPDAASEKKNYKDAEYLIRERMVSADWAKDKWTHKADEIDTATDTEDEEAEEADELHLNVTPDQYQAPNDNERPGGGTKQVKLTEYQYKRRIPFYRVADPQTRQLAELNEAEYQRVTQAAARFGIKIEGVRQSRCRYYRAFAIGDILLEYGPCPDPNAFTYKAITAKRDRSKRCWYGLVRGMKDPQRWANKWLSQSMHLLNSNAKGGVMIEQNAVDDVTQFERSWAKSDQITWVKAGTLSTGKIQPKQPPAFPTQLSQLMTFAIQSIRDVSGVSVELLGVADRDQPASLEYQRKQAGVTILATLFDALRRYRKEQGRSLFYLINTYIADGRLIRVVGEEGAKYVPLMRRPDTIKYDIVVDESPTAPNQKEQVWLVLRELLPLLVKMGMQVPPELLKYLPLPASITDKFSKPDPQKQQEAAQAKALALKEKLADIEKTQGEAKRAEAEAFLKMVDARLKEAEIANGPANENAKLAVMRESEGQKLAMQRQAADQEMRLKWLDAMLEKWKAEQEIAIKRQSAADDAALNRDKLEADAAAKGVPEVKRGTQSMNDSFKGLAELLKELQATINAPEEIVRDSDGRVVGKRKVTMQ